jgi:hypothetical protein
VDQVLKVITDGCVSKISLNDFRKSHTNKNNMINMQNSEFLRETLLIHRFKKIVNDVDPHSLNHDINLLFLNENDTTVLKREDADSSFIHVLQGEVDVKIFVPNDSITFDPSVCEITGDNISRYDAWKNTYVESIKMCIKKNEFLRVPQHWWYTLSSKDTETILGVYKTDTIFTYLQKIVITSGKIINDNISLKDNNYLKL